MHLVYNKHQCYNRKDLGGESMFFKRANQIIDLLNDHLEAVDKCYCSYIKNFKEIVNNQSKLEKVTLNTLATEVKSLEHEADVIRHKVILELLQGGFLVDSRKSTMRLVEGLDQVADLAAEIMQMIVYEQIVLDDFLKDPLSQMNEITGKQLNSFIDVLSKLITKYELEHMIEQVRQIEAYESEVDVIEDELLSVLFSMDMPLANKLHYKQLIKMVSRMSDLIEDLSDEIEIILASRMI